jgi:hypothetical protein
MSIVLFLKKVIITKSAEIFKIVLTKNKEGGGETKDRPLNLSYEKV